MATRPDVRIVYQSESADRPCSIAYRTLRPATWPACSRSRPLLRRRKIGYVLEFAGPVAAIVWLPVGVGIAFLYLGGLRFWPGVLIGDLLANDYSALPLGSALGQTCGNVLEVARGDAAAPAPRARTARRSTASAASARMRRRDRRRRRRSAPRSGRSRSGSASVIASDEVPTVWRTWWLGDSSRRAGRRAARPRLVRAAADTAGRARRWLEAALLLVAVVGAERARAARATSRSRTSSSRR